MTEHWQGAYERIMREVEADMPDAEDADQYAEYRSRCQQWKRERAI